jgi:hypothetical protein
MEPILDADEEHDKAEEEEVERDEEVAKIVVKRERFVSSAIFPFGALKWSFLKG